MMCDDCGNRVRLVHDYEPGYAPKRSHPVRLAPTPESSAEADAALRPFHDRITATMDNPSLAAWESIALDLFDALALSRPATPPLDVDDVAYVIHQQLTPNEDGHQGEELDGGRCNEIAARVVAALANPTPDKEVSS